MNLTDKRALERASNAAQPLTLVIVNRIGEQLIVIEDLEELYADLNTTTANNFLVREVQKIIRETQLLEREEV